MDSQNFALNKKFMENFDVIDNSQKFSPHITLVWHGQMLRLDCAWSVCSNPMVWLYQTNIAHSDMICDQFEYLSVI